SERREDAPIRLAYRLTILTRGSGGIVTPELPPSGESLSDSETKRMAPRLQALDQAIVRELRASTTFGHLADANLSRVLPLLVQRQTKVDGQALRISDDNLMPRLRVEPGTNGQMIAVLGLKSKDGTWQDVREGRLFAGSQAYFMRGNVAYTIASPAPWELTRWAREPSMMLDFELSPSARDNLVRDLTKVGVPAEDLVRLAVRREPPRAFYATIVSVDFTKEPTVRIKLEADYAGERVSIEGQRPVSVHVAPAADGQGLVERDLLVEENTRRLLRDLGFRFERTDGTFIVSGEQALRVLDPKGDALPDYWNIDRGEHTPVFRRDLNVRARVQLLEERGLIDIQLGVDAVRENGEPVNDDQLVQELVGMKELLTWLASGKQYVQLSDGSFVAPSARFRRSLRLLEDLGATAERALVSPLCVGILRAIGDEAGLATADEATKAWLDELSSSNAPPVATPPKDLNGTLRDYQARGLDWLSMLHRHRLTGILADDMGLGKTVQALALLLKVKEDEGQKPSLVIAPTSVVTVWRDEAARFAPTLKTVLWHGPPKERQAIDIASCDVVVTSYGVLRRDAELLSANAFRYVILDEAQSAKNAASQNARAIRQLKSERRLALTGTPVENRPDDLWAIFDFL
ncbi:MAG: DEAD/DEAH box helicase, partial [Clostridia bacterium]|nr:DEAD/DEAH box helicase [Deltaproteobacteria bacterium]